MKTAADFARASILMRELANQLKPDDRAQAISEALAAKEGAL